MRQRFAVLAGTVLLAFAAATGAAAQDDKPAGSESPRRGFFLSLGAGVGSIGFECGICDADDRTNGGSGFLRLGGNLGAHFQLGGELNVWGATETENDLEMAAAAVQISGSWYPSRTGGFFLKAGVGALAYVEERPFHEVAAAGGSFSLGIGWDLRLGRSFAITPYLNSIVTSNSEVELDGVRLPGIEINPTLVQVGLAISWL